MQREREQERDAEREREREIDRETEWVCRYHSLPEHTLMNKSSTNSNEETRNSSPLWVFV